MASNVKMKALVVCLWCDSISCVSNTISQQSFDDRKVAKHGCSCIAPEDKTHSNKLFSAMKYTYIGGVLKDGFYRRIHNSARGNKRAQKKALGSLYILAMMVQPF